tara:strand:+ start:1209 stop:3092 length:1884 start_codon:yes stop_codon:yes gene_type:complete
MHRKQLQPTGRKTRRAVLVPLITLFLIAAGMTEAEAKRLALVIGNSDYSGVTPLKNASRDATDVAASLDKLGFEVTLLTDVSSVGFWDRVEAFAEEAKTAESTVFFYSGHAFQLNGANYLVPVDAKLDSRESIRTETWNLDGIIARLQDRKRQTLIFLDACRNDPLPKSVRGSETPVDGLARLQTGVGTFVAFATAPGAVTYDGAGDAPNSPFTTALLENIETPGISVSDMMINVRNNVEERTFRRQTPWDQSSLREQFYFNPAVETKQELSEADFELLAQLSPGDRKKFLDLLRASGFSDSSLRKADTAIEVASLGLELAATDGGVTIGDAGPAAPATGEVIVGDAGGTVAPPTSPAPASARKPADPLALEIVASAVTIGDAPTAPQPDIQIASAATRPAPRPPAIGQSTSVARVEETQIPLLPREPAALQTATGNPAIDEAPPIRLAALTWETRGIVGINALAVDRLRVEGTEITPDTDANRDLLASIDPALLQEEPKADINQLSKRELASAAQTELRRLGCYQMAVDGSWGRGSRTALTSYYLAKRTVPDSLDPSPELLDQLLLETSVVCAVRVSSVAPSVRAKAQSQVEAAAVKINPRTNRRINAPAKVKKEIKKSLLGSGSF